MTTPLAVYIAFLLQEAKAQAKAQALTHTSIQDAAMLSLYPQAEAYAVPKALDATPTAELSAEVAVVKTASLDLMIDDMAVVTPITVTPDNEASSHVAVNANNASNLDAVVNGYSLHAVADEDESGEGEGEGGADFALWGGVIGIVALVVVGVSVGSSTTTKIQRLEEDALVLIDDLIDGESPETIADDLEQFIDDAEKDADVSADETVDAAHIAHVVGQFFQQVEDHLADSSVEITLAGVFEELGIDIQAISMDVFINGTFGAQISEEFLRVIGVDHEQAYGGVQNSLQAGWISQEEADVFFEMLIEDEAVPAELLGLLAVAKVAEILHYGRQLLEDVYNGNASIDGVTVEKAESYLTLLDVHEAYGEDTMVMAMLALWSNKSETPPFSADTVREAMLDFLNGRDEFSSDILALNAALSEIIERLQETGGEGTLVEPTDETDHTSEEGGGGSCRFSCSCCWSNSRCHCTGNSLECRLGYYVR